MRCTLTLILITCSLVWVYGQNSSKKTRCEALINKASTSYNVVFNYSTEILNNSTCIDTIPASLDEFRTLLAETSGLQIEQFKENLWVISKKYSHHIKIENSENQPIFNATLSTTKQASNRYGNIFIQSLNTPQSFTISHPDYIKQDILILPQTNKTIKVVLQSKPIDLPEVILNSLYTNSIYLNNNNHIQVKNKKMPLLAGQTQQDAFVSLLNLPQLSSNVESVAELSIKGGVNDQNLILWNGIRMFQNSHFFGLLTSFNENLIDEMVVIDNATPVEYGNALTGTIKLDFDKEIIQKNQYGIGVNNLSGQVFSRLALDRNTELSLAFQRSFTDFYNSSTFQSYSKKAFRDTDLELSENANTFNNNIKRDNDFYFSDAQFQLKKQIGNSLKINFQGIWFENKLRYNESINFEEERESEYDSENAAIGLDATYSFYNNQHFVFRSNYSKHFSEGANNTFSGNLNTNQLNTVENYFTQAYWQKKMQRGNIKAGIDFQGSIVVNRFTNAVTEALLNLGQVSNVYSAFGSYTYEKNKWRIFTGIRNVYYQKDIKWSIEPRWSISYKLNKNISAVVKGEIKSQNLKQIIDLDQNFLGIEKRRWIASGDSIAPPLQQTTQLEAMLKWNFNRFGGYASVYSRSLKGLSSNDQRFQNEGEFNQNIDGEVDIFGVLLHLYYKKNWFNTWLSYAHLKENLVINNQVFNGNNNLDHQLTWGNNIHFKNWNFSFAINYHNGLPFTAVSNQIPILQEPNGINTINFRTPNENKLPSYFRLDASLQYQLKTKQIGNFKFSIGLINLTNQHNILRRNFRLNRVNNQLLQKTEDIGLGFTTNIGIIWML